MIVIVGAGLAGAKAAEALRDEGYRERILMIGDEEERPYTRPPLSKDYLRGRSEKAKIYAHPAGWYQEHGIELRLGKRVTAVDPARHRVTLAGTLAPGESIGYDKLLLCTGASARTVNASVGATGQVLTLRSVADCERMRESFATGARRGQRVTVVGAGWLGLEVAAAARDAGLEVTLVARGELPLLGGFGPEIASVFARLHRNHGVTLRVGAGVVGIRDQAAGDSVGPGVIRRIAVELDDGSSIQTDLVVVAIGATPNDQLAAAAGLAVGDGIHVDEQLRTSDPDIFAAGDVASVYHPLLRRRLRFAHWHTAATQPRVVAKSMLGEAASYQQVPYFYSDQYELGMECAGHLEPGGYDEVVIRGDLDAPRFIAFWLKDHVVLAGMNVNIWTETQRIKALIRSGITVESAKLADSSVPLPGAH
ncbi:MAG: FAD-dependent oxidoreductase [Microbacteriaceae bacterium]